MNIEIDYNPVIPLTSLKINNKPNDNIFGALYPVRRYPLQAWLNKNGAWTGLLKVLKDITRGRRFTLTFKGRNMDFEDLTASLPGINAEFFHILAYENSEEKAFIEKNLEDLQFLLDYPHIEIAGKAKSLINLKTEAKVDEFTKAEQMKELLNVIKSTRRLVLIDAKIFHEITEPLKKSLYGNFNRPADSVAIKVADETECLKYSSATEYRMNVVTPDDSMIEILTEKYSVPEAIGEEYQRLHRLAEFINELLQRKKSLRKLNSEIRDDCEEDSRESTENEYTQNTDEIRWIMRNEAALLKIMALILEKTEDI